MRKRSPKGGTALGIKSPPSQSCMNTSSSSFLTWLQNGRTRLSVPNPCWASVTTEPAPEKRRSPQGLVAHFYKEPKTLLAFAKLFLLSVPPTGVLQGGESRNTSQPRPGLCEILAVFMFHRVVAFTRENCFNLKQKWNNRHSCCLRCTDQSAVDGNGSVFK